MAERQSALTSILDIRRHEWPLALLMFAYFFLVITTFWILKPLKKGIFIGFYDQAGLDLLGWQLTAAQAELLAKVLNMVVALIAVTVFSWLARSLRRQQLTHAFSAFFGLCFILYAGAIDAGGGWVVWSFYLLGDLYSTLMVATFFAFLNDSVHASDAKRLYGLIGLGGVSGGWFGSAVLRAKIRDLSHSEWLWVCLGVGALIALIAWLAGRRVDAATGGSRETAADTPAAAERTPGNPALVGARLVLR